MAVIPQLDYAMPSLSLTLFVGVLSLLGYGLFLLVKFVVSTLRTPVRQLQGPASPSFWSGVEWHMILAENGTLIHEWMDSFGMTCKYPSFLGKYELCTCDPKAIGYIMTNSYTYPKPFVVREMLSGFLGEGLISAEGETHKRQRRVLNPPFSPAQIREVTPIFFDKVIEMRDVWQAFLVNSPTPDGTTIDTYKWLSRATLDIIGSAGFGYEFSSLLNDDNELAVAFRELFLVQMSVRMLTLVRMWITPLRYVIPEPGRNQKNKSMATMRRIGLDLINKKKVEAVRSMQGEKDTNVSKSSIGGRDLLSALIRANMANDISPTQRLTDDEVLSQITTFILAGHETTSNGVTWALLALAQNLDVQTRLREELLAVAEDTPSMDDLNALPYLDLVCREVLRLHAPVRETVRVASQADIIPLSFPIKDRHGNTLRSVRVAEGDAILVPIMAMNRSKVFWGPTALEFIPERFKDLPPEMADMPGVYSHMMTFLAGQRACIGYRFSVVEMKVFLFVLLRSFSFDVSDPNMIIGKKSSIVTRPIVVGEEDKGAQLPLLVRPLHG